MALALWVAFNIFQPGRLVGENNFSIVIKEPCLESAVSLILFQETDQLKAVSVKDFIGLDSNDYVFVA